jgi:hypothetical protein
VYLKLLVKVRTARLLDFAAKPSTSSRSLQQQQHLQQDFRQQ